MTFFRATELPFARFAGVDYNRFAVNIQPDDHEETPRRLSQILRDPSKLSSLQRGVEEYQRRFLWDPPNPSGVYATLMDELRHRMTHLEAPETVIM